jgi:predicted nucleotidyltransferase
VSIILSTKENALYEVSMSFHLSGVIVAPLNYIMKLKGEQKLNQSHLSIDLTLSLLLSDDEDSTHVSVCFFKNNSLISKVSKWH